MKDTGFAAQLNTTGGANTYRFKSFKQRVEGIEINVSRRVKRDLDEPEEYDSYLAEAVLKWGELNCTNDFTELLRKIRDYHQSLAQVLYHKEQIVGVLESYLSMDHEGVLEPVLDLVTTLARDLQDEFMPFYQQLVQRILPLMKVENPEIVEWSCNALAYLFKYLSKSLVANLSSTFDLVAPILGTERQKAHTRRFAAESLAFLIRKLRGDSLQTFVGHVVQALVACPDKRVAGFREGIALLFFECIRSVDGRLHSRASGLLTALLAELYKESCGRRLEDNQVYLLTLSIIKMCLHYVKRDTSEQIWSVLLSEYDAQVRAITGSKAGRLEPYCALLGLLASATILRKGSRVRDYKALFQRCQSAFEIASLVSSEKYKKPADEKCVAVMAHERIKWLSGLLLQSNVTEMVAVGRLLLDAVFESESMKTALSMALTLARLEWSQWNQILLPYLVQLTVSKWADHKNILLLFWAELFQLDMFKSSTASISSVITSRGQILFPSASGKKAKKAASTSVSQSLLQWLLEPIEWSDLLDHQITIPSGEATMFSGFDDSEDDNTSMASKSSSSGDSKNSVVSELSIKSAILSVLTNISIDASVLVDGLDSFCTQLSTSIVQITAQLAKDSEYLQHTSANAKQRYDIGPADGEIWGDEASEALGLHTAKDDRLYWGPYHQLHPLITLLGRAMALKATTAMHAPPASAATTLMNRWTDVVANILPTHYANPSLIDGVYQIADALKFVTTMNRGGSDAVPEEVKEQFASAMSTTQLEVVMRSVESNLVSVQPTLRLKTLQLLSLFDQLPLEESDEDSFSKRHGKKQPAEQCPAIQLAIELESTETSLAMYKEKLNHLRRLTVLASNGRIPGVYQNVLPFVALGQLSVNFSMLWPEIIKQMGLLAGAKSDLFWSAVWGLLRRFNDERLLIETGLTPDAKKWLANQQAAWEALGEFASLPKLDGHAMECPNLTRFDRVFDHDRDNFSENLEEGSALYSRLQYLMIGASSPDVARTDYTNIRKQLFKMLADVGAQAAEPHSKPLVQTFLVFVQDDYGWTSSFFDRHQDKRFNIDLAGVCALDHRWTLTERSKRASEELCALWLKLFAKFRRPRSLFASEALYSLYLRLLTKGDNATQLLAIECILTWQDSEINTYAENLRNLLDERKFRDELTVFDMSATGESINAVHRAKLMPVLLRLLYGQTLVRNGKSARKDGMKIRRISILSAMVGMTRMELRQFVGIGLDSFADFITPATPADKLVGDEAAPFKLLSETPESDNAMDVDDDEAPRGKGHRVAMAAQVSFFKLLAEMIKQLGFKATPIFHEALVVLLRSTYEAQKQLDAANLELQAYLAAKGDAMDAAVADADDPADNDEDEDEDDDNNVNDDEEVAADEETAGDERGRIESKRRQARMIRQLATRGLTGLFTLQTPDFDFEPYMPCVYEVVVNPRLDLLSVENTQNPSALLLLFRSWTLTPKYLPYLTGYNPRTFSMLVSILVAPKVQAPVVNLILDILQTYLDYSPEQAEKAFRLTPEQAEACGVIAKQTIQDHVSQILSHMKVCFAGVFSEAAAQGQTGKSSNILLRQIHLLSRVADYTTQQTADAKVLLDLLLPMLKRPNGAVNERTKADVLAIMLRFVPIVLDQNDDTFTDDERLALFNTYVDTVSVGLSRLRLPTARSLMCEILSVLARIDLERGHPQLEVAAGIVQDVNAFSEHRIDEPDFDRRLAAYAKLNDEIWDKPDQLSARAWVPILHNLVFFAQDHDEMSIRSNASYGLLRFIARVKQANTCEEAEGSDEVRLVNRNVVSIVLPSIKHAFTSKHDIVRNEFLVILRTAVREVGQYFDQLRDLQVLDNPDEEANFYYNIMHIQTHRRMRAMRRFRALVTANANEDVEMAEPLDAAESDAEDESDDGNSDAGEEEKPAAEPTTIKPFNFDPPSSPISMANLRNLFMPLFEHWVMSTDRSVSADLAHEAVQTIGALGAVMPWSMYNSTLRKYLSVIKKTPNLEKRLLRLVLALLDNFHFDLRNVQVDAFGHVLGRSADQPLDEDNEDDVENAAKELQAERIHESLVRSLIPELKRKIGSSDEDAMVLRAPVAMAVIRLLTILPEQTKNLQLPGVLTNICNMLRAKSLSARSATRDTLMCIAKFLGAGYFGFIVKELSSALARGFHKHILSYTIYILLKEMASLVEVGDLDYTLEAVIEILVRDVFGEAALEKDADEWTTKIKEAKVHHGPDCFEILAQITKFSNVRLMLAPLRDILQETDTPKRTKLVDRLLHQISVGLNRNRTYETKTVLLFSHSIIKQYLALSTKTAKDTEANREQMEQQKRLKPTGDELVTVHMLRKDVMVKRDYLPANAHRFVHFGLELVYLGLKRERFDTSDTDVLGLLDPFVDLTGDGLYSRYNSVITMCCKAWTVLVRLPLPSLAGGIPVVIKRLFYLFRQSSNTNSDMIQSAFKLLASLLRSKTAEHLMEGYVPEELEELVPEKKDKKGKKTKQPARPKSKVQQKSLLTDDQLRDLIDFIRPDIEEPERQATAFGLIRAILTRRMIVDSLYTLMDTVRELMVTAQVAHVRELCRLTWFQFLMDYPLGERRINSAMSFIVQNATGYVFESGRSSALEIMGVIVNRFADEVLLPTAAEPFFLGLVLIIAKDESTKCREMATHLLPQLVARFDQTRLARVWILLDQWSAGTAASAQAIEDSGDDKAMRAARVKQLKMRELGRAALQCYGIIIEPLGDKFRSQKFLAAIDSALTVSLKTWATAEARLNYDGGDLEQIAMSLGAGEDPQDAALAYWETAYMAMNSFAKYIRTSGSLGDSRIWLLVVRHLTHPHSWVRLAAARLIGLYVASADPAWMLTQTFNEQPAEESWDVPAFDGQAKYALMSFERLRELANALVVQLSSKYLTAELGNQIVKNLFFIAKCFLAAVPEDAANEAPVDEAPVNEDVNGDESEEETTEHASLPMERGLSWLVNRVGRLARTELIRGRGATDKRTYSFRWFAAVVTIIPPALLCQSSYIMPIVSPLYRTLNDTQLAREPVTLPDGVVKKPEELLDELKALTNEVVQLTQARMGTTEFSKAMQKVKSHVDRVREQRKEQRKQLAIIDPELHAQKKLKKHKAYKRSRSERNQELARKKIRTVVKKARNMDI